MTGKEGVTENKVRVLRQRVVCPAFFQVGSMVVWAMKSGVKASNRGWMEKAIGGW